MRKVALHPLGERGRGRLGEEFEVEELFPAFPPSSSSFRGLEMLTSEENFPVIYPRELVDQFQQGTEVLSPRLCRAMGHQEWFEPSRYTRTDE